MFGLGIATVAASLLLSTSPSELASLEPVGDLSGGDWIGLIGEEPTLESLKGRAVLLHFIEVEKNLDQANWPIVRQFAHDYEDKGLVILTFTEGSRSNVEAYLGSYNACGPVCVGGNARSSFAVSGSYHLILLDRQGETFWRGPCNGLWNGKLLKGIKGAQRLGERGPLALHLEGEIDKKLRKIAEQCGQGELGAALSALEGVIEGERTPDETRDAAKAIVERIEAHVARLRTQIETAFGSGDVLAGHEALQVLAKELKRHPLGPDAAQRLEEVAEDKSLQHEIAAAELLEKLMTGMFKRGLEKNRARFEKLLEDFAVTRTAQKARNILMGH